MPPSSPPPSSRSRGRVPSWFRYVRLAPPTLAGMATATTAVLLGASVAVLFVIPSVFYLGPMPREADGVTVCIPGLGPLQRVRDGLPGEQEELAYIHEAIHARQCEEYGALWYAEQATDPLRRLELEAQALCAEADVLFRRGRDGGRLVDWTVTRLTTDYFSDGAVPGWAISGAVTRACRDLLVAAGHAGRTAPASQGIPGGPEGGEVTRRRTRPAPLPSRLATPRP